MSPHVGATLVVARTTAEGNFLLAGDNEDRPCTPTNRREIFNHG